MEEEVTSDPWLGQEENFLYQIKDSLDSWALALNELYPVFHRKNPNWVFHVFYHEPYEELQLRSGRCLVAAIVGRGEDGVVDRMEVQFNLLCDLELRRVAEESLKKRLPSGFVWESVTHASRSYGLAMTKPGTSLGRERVIRYRQPQ